MSHFKQLLFYLDLVGLWSIGVVLNKRKEKFPNFNAYITFHKRLYQNLFSNAHIDEHVGCVYTLTNIVMMIII